jgi:hypothetical protein
MGIWNVYNVFRIPREGEVNALTMEDPGGMYSLTGPGRDCARTWIYYISKRARLSLCQPRACAKQRKEVTVVACLPLRLEKRKEKGGGRPERREAASSRIEKGDKRSQKGVGEPALLYYRITN